MEECLLKPRVEEGVQNFLSTDLSEFGTDESAKLRTTYFVKLQVEEEVRHEEEWEEEEEKVEEMSTTFGESTPELEKSTKKKKKGGKGGKGGKKGKKKKGAASDSSKSKSDSTGAKKPSKYLA